MNKLTEIIKTQIRDKGRITFAEFMELALYQPSYGYYSSGKSNIGKDGDYYTSPHVHPAFGQVIGNFILKCFDYLNLDKPGIVELGAGKGYLALDILDQINIQSPDYYRRLNYYIVEKNNNAINNSKEILARHSEKIIWLSEIEELYNKNINGVVLSNELFDALPFHRMKFVNGHMFETYTTLESEEFIDTLYKPSSLSLEEYIKSESLEFEDGQEFEINLSAETTLRKIDKALDSGVILTIDYGYLSQELFNPERRKGTYKCLYNHEINEKPYINIGNQDITAHVDFGNLIKVGESIGLGKVHYTTQGQFLVDWGILDIANKSSEKEIHAVKNLFLPELMGDKFKVLIQSKIDTDLKDLYPESPFKISFNVL